MIRRRAMSLQATMKALADPIRREILNLLKKIYNLVFGDYF